MLYIIKNLMVFGLSAETTGLVLNIVLGGLLPLLIYNIAKVITNNREISLISALLTAVHPSLIELSTEVQREMVYLVLCGLFLYFFIRAIQEQKTIFYL